MKRTDALPLPANLTSPAPARRRLRRSSALLSLEQRFMFDGAAVATAADAAHPTPEAAPPDAAADSPDHPAAVQARESEPAQARKEVVFIESNVTDYEALAAGVRDGVEVVILDASQDGLAQIAGWAATHSGYDAIHIVSHGSEGSLDLGSLSLDSQSASIHAAELASIGAALAADGDLLLYGCNVATGTGQDFIATLGTLSGADVAASTDPTGAASLGGDWQLEASTGNIGTQAALGDELLAGYDAVLANPTITGVTYDAHANILTVTCSGLVAGDLIDTSKLTVIGDSNGTYTLTSGIVTATASGFSVVLNSTDQVKVEALLNRNGTHALSGHWLFLDSAANWNLSQTSAADTSNNITVSNMNNYCFTFETDAGVEEDSADYHFQWLEQTLKNLDDLTGSEETLSITDQNGEVMLGDTYEMIYGGSNYHVYGYNGLMLHNNNNYYSSSTATFVLASGNQFTPYMFAVEDTYNSNIPASYIYLTTESGGYLYHPNADDIVTLKPSSSDPLFQDVTSFSITLPTSAYQPSKVVIDNLYLTNVHTATASFSSGATATTAENSSGTVYQATATGESTITYSLAGADAALFNIDTNTGAVSFKNAPDHEAPQDVGADNVYDFLVIASNADGNTSKAIAVTVTDVDEAPVVTSGSIVSVAENSTGPLYTATATDPEGGSVTWSLGGADASLFSIDPATGAVTFTHTIISTDPATGGFVSQTAPDYEHPSDANGDNTYSIVVQATDNGTGSLTGSKTVSIVVTDVNETPAITSAATASIAENSNGTVYTATGVDPDGGPLTWSLSGTDAALFDIDSSTGALSFKTAPNYEAPVDGNGDNVYQVTLTATDNGATPISVTRNLTLTVTDANDAPEIFSNANLTGASEDSSFTIAYADLVAAVYDEDGDALGYLIDTVSSGTLTKDGVPVQAGTTLLGPGESLVWTPAANANGTLTAFTIRAHDGNLASATAVDVRVQVAPADDAPTDIALSSSSVPEHASTATPVNVGTLSSTDPDSGNSFTYSIVGGADQGVFQISGDTLQIKAGTPLDYETQSSYSVTVRSTDNTGLTHDKTLTVSLTDQNDAPGIGTNAGLSVNEGSTTTLSTAQLSITDVDSPAASLTVTLDSVPAHGTLSRSGTPLAAGDSFTQADIAAGLITYTHDGSETTADGFAFSVSDGAGGTLATTAFAISVTPVNEAPTVVTTPFGLAPTDQYLVDTRMYSVTTADVNNDGIVDLLTSGYATVSNNPNAFSVLLGNGDGTFTYKSSFGYGQNAGNVISADLNNDGNMDISSTYDSSTLAIYLGNGDGTFTSGGETWIQAGVRDLVATDVDGDGNVDLVMTDAVNNRVVIMTGNGDGTLDPLYAFPCGANAYGITIADVNGDGHTDLITANFNDSTVSVLTGNGDGSFNPQATYAVAGGPLDVITGDFNGDGILDLATSNRDGENVSVLIGDGNGGFGNRTDYPVAFLANSLGTADLNGDGYLDLVVASNYEQTYSVLLGNGDGSFDPRMVYSQPGSPRSVNLVDVNGDGKSDVVLALFVSQSAGVILNTSQFASFTEQQGPVRVNPDIAINEPDGEAGWNGSQLTVQITANAAATDQLGLPTANPGGSGIWIDTAGNKLMAGTLQIGTASATSVSGATAWTFTFNANATNALVQDVARAVTFDNGSDNPGSASRSVTFTVTDAGNLSASASTLVAIHAVNDAPTLQTNAGLTLNEGASVTLGTSHLNTTDPDSSDASLTYTLTAVPSHGNLAKSGVPLAAGDSFTQADLAAGLITYTHDGGESTADGFSLSVSDGAGASIASTAFAISVNPVNDAPTLTLPGSFTVVEDVSQALTGISFADADSGTDPVTVTLAVNAGSLAAVSGAGVTVAGSGSASLTLTGSVSSINAFIAAAGVVYTPAPDATANTTLSATIHDGGHAGAGGDKSASAASVIGITPVNDTPTLQTNAGLTLNEGASATLGTGLLAVADVDSPATSLTLTLDSVPSHGSLYKSGVPLAAGDSFTQADLAAGRITYIHDGSETTADGFSFSVSDGAGASIATTAFAITVNPVNDAPTLTLPGSFSVVEDTPQVLTGISFADVDSGNAPVTVTLAVNAGSLAAASGAGVSVAGSGSAGLTLTGSVASINAFIAAGNVVYTPAPDATASATLSATIRDGGRSGTGGDRSASAASVIGITPVNDAPVIANLAGDAVAYLMGSGAQVIDRDVAAGIVDVDAPDFDGATLTVSIVGNHVPGEDQLSVLAQDQIGVSGNAITYGGIVIGTFSGGTGTSDLVVTFNANASATAVSALVHNVTYLNSDTATATENTRTVRFVLTDSEGASSAPADASVTVSRNTPPTADDGNVTVLGNGSYVFSTGDFHFCDADAGDGLSHITITGLPDGGTLTLDGVAVTAGQQVSAADIAAGKLLFTPAANANGSASFNFTVSDGKNDSAAAYTETVTILAVNDAPSPTIPDQAAATGLPPPSADTVPTGAAQPAGTDPIAAAPPPGVDFLSPQVEAILGNSLSLAGTGLGTLLAAGDGNAFPELQLSEVELRDMELRLEALGEARADRDGLVINQGMADQVVDAAGVTEIPVPADVFTHTSPDALIRLAARQANGRPLPDWVKFDPASGKFIVRPPQGVAGELTIRLTARDAAGREVSTEFSLRVGTRHGHLEPSGRQGLSEQIRQAAQVSGQADRYARWARSLPGMSA